MKTIMKYCKKCVQPDTRPRTAFDEAGICLACRYAESIDSIDWGARQKELRGIAEWAKKGNKGGYDCVIGVSGGKDSTFQAIYSRDELGLNPLLVNSVPEEITEIGKHNIDNLAHLGFDLFMIRPNPNIMRKLMKRDFYKYLNPQKVTEYSLWASAYQVALAYGIPLIIQGENEALTLGAAEGLTLDGDAFNVCQSNTLAGGDAIHEYGNEVDPKHLLLYQFPKTKLLKQAGLRAIYLQYYIKEWGWRHNGEFAIAHGLRGREDDLNEIGRYTRFGAVDSELNVVNQMLKYFKFGFGCATDEACFDIREGGRITRREAIELVKKYDGKCGEKYIRDFCDYLEITVNEFWRVVDQFVNKDLFEKEAGLNEWIPKFEIGVDLTC